MTESSGKRGQPSGVPHHARWVRISHWIATVSVLTLAFSGFVILMAHPRLYWGEVGNGLTPALLELPISRNHQHRGWGPPTPFFVDAAGPVSANRNYRIFNQNGWGRSLHFLAAWLLVVTGAVYLLTGIFAGHFRAHIWPSAKELALRRVWRDVVDHLRLQNFACQRAAEPHDPTGVGLSFSADDLLCSTEGAPQRSLDLLRCYYNFVRAHRALKFGAEIRTPAMQAGLTTRRLTLREIFPSAMLLWFSEKVKFGTIDRLGHG